MARDTSVATGASGASEVSSPLTAGTGGSLFTDGTNNATPAVGRQTIERGERVAFADTNDEDDDVLEADDDPGEPGARNGTMDGERTRNGEMSSEDEDDEDGNTADERNEELSQADLSSVGSVAVEAAPTTQSLVWLGEDRCRITMSCK